VEAHVARLNEKLGERDEYIQVMKEQRAINDEKIEILEA
jgi:hypothetical protein